MAESESRGRSDSTPSSGDRELERLLSVLQDDAPLVTRVGDDLELASNRLVAGSGRLPQAIAATEHYEAVLLKVRKDLLEGKQRGHFGYDEPILHAIDRYLAATRLLLEAYQSLDHPAAMSKRSERALREIDHGEHFALLFVRRILRRLRQLAEDSP